MVMITDSSAYTGESQPSESAVSVPCIYVVKLLRKMYIKIPHISEDHICGLQIFQQKTVSVHFYTGIGPNY
jgi:hypothetical protein